jgi:hypothetical protein
MEHDLIVIDLRDNETREDKFGLTSIADLSRLARAMSLPLRRTIDYQSIGRKVFLVQQLQDIKDK